MSRREKGNAMPCATNIVVTAKSIAHDMKRLSVIVVVICAFAVAANTLLGAVAALLEYTSQGLCRHVPCKPYSIANETKPRPADSSAMPICIAAVKNAPCYLLVG